MNRTKPERNSALLICLLLVLTTIAAYWPVRQCDFVNYDDQEYVTENVHVLSGITREGIGWAFRNTEFANWHPLTWLSHMLDCQLYGLKPAGHHLTNLLLHLANTLLLFLLLSQMTREPEHGTGAGLEDSYRSGRHLWASAMVAALFAVHPTRVESVAWVAERKDVLSTLFFLLTIWAYVRFARSMNRKPGALVLSLIFFILGLMSKPMLVTLPFVLLLLDYWPLGRFRNSTSRSLFLEKSPFLLLSIIASVVAFLAQSGAGAVASTTGFPFSYRVANAFVSYARYLGKTFWPVDLAVFYPHPGIWPLWQVIAAGFLVAFVSWLVFRERRRRPYLAVGWCWFLGTLVPVIGLVQVGMQSMADRYSYVPLIGIFIMVAWLAADLSLLARRVKSLGVAGVLVVLASIVVTREQLKHWQNSESLFEHALQVTKNNDVALNGLAGIRYRQGKVDEAVAYLREAVRLRPGYAQAHNNLGGILLTQDKVEEAMGHLTRCLEINPNNASAHNNLGLALSRQGKPAQAVVHFETALRLSLTDSDAHNNLGSIAYDEGRFEEAVTHFRAALQASPKTIEPRQNLAVALAGLGRRDEAIAHLERALRLKPDSPILHGKLGTLRLEQSRLTDARSEFLETLRLKPDSPEAHNNLGLISARQNKLDEAITHFRNALSYDSNLAPAHLNLGRALSGNGQLDEAEKHFTTAIRLKPSGSEAHNGLAFVYARQGRFADAEREFLEALKRGADPAESHRNLARACEAQKKVEEAIGHYRKALESKAGDGDSLNDLAWLLATHPDSRYRNASEALKLAERAVELTPRREPGKLDTLAAALAESGRFSDAEKIAREAIAIARETNQGDLAQQIESRLKSYQQQRPWRE